MDDIQLQKAAGSLHAGWVVMAGGAMPVLTWANDPDDRRSARRFA
jgi:hypothetical protein